MTTSIAAQQSNHRRSAAKAKSVFGALGFGAAVLASAGLAGCVSPASKMVTAQFAFTTNGIVIHNPKDLTIQRFEFQDMQRGVVLKVDGYSNVADANALQANVAQAQLVGQALQSGIQMGQNLAGAALSAYGIHIPAPNSTNNNH